MESSDHRIVWQLLLGLSSLVCLLTALTWIRLTYAMHKSGKALPLALPFPIVMMMDIYTVLLRQINQTRLSPRAELGLENMRFKSTIINNYLKAFILLIFGFLAGLLAFQMRQ